MSIKAIIYFLVETVLLVIFLYVIGAIYTYNKKQNTPNKNKRPEATQKPNDHKGEIT